MFIQCRTLLLVLFVVKTVSMIRVIEKTVEGELVNYLEADSIVDSLPKFRGHQMSSDLHIYCYNHSTKTFLRLFESIEMVLTINEDDYTLYVGLSPQEVQTHYDEHNSLFNFNMFSRKRSRIAVSPFAQKCIGIETSAPYSIHVEQLRVDFWRVVQFTIGIALFIYSGQLGHNPLFYYISGILLGIFLSFIAIIWLASKLIPRRPVMYGFVLGGWAISVYVLQKLWENVQFIVLTYRTYIFWYVVLTGIISFFICYRWGPLKDERSKNIVKWFLQIFSLLLVFFSSHYEEATVSINIIIVSFYYFPRSFVNRFRKWYYKRYPPKIKLLTIEEYDEQGVLETSKALDELRAFVNSPECKQWKVVSKLKHPLRFAAFVEGDSHLCDEEIIEFENSKP